MIDRIGVCSWSLQPESPDELAQTLARIGATGVQLALDPLRSGAWTVDATRAALERVNVAVLSGMWAPIEEDYSTLETIRESGGVFPDRHWRANLENASRIAEIARELNLDLVTFHAGFVPDGPKRQVMIDRLRHVIDVFAACGVRVAFETGQETAESQQSVLRDLARPGAGINFDPANMILYGTGDPTAALRALMPHVVQAHVKDAVPTNVPGQWGTEMRAGDGAVDWPAFFRAIKELDRPINLIVEREAGNTRAADVAHALELIGTYNPPRH